MALTTTSTRSPPLVSSLFSFLSLLLSGVSFSTPYLSVVVYGCEENASPNRTHPHNRRNCVTWTTQKMHQDETPLRNGKFVLPSSSTHNPIHPHSHPSTIPSIHTLIHPQSHPPHPSIHNPIHPPSSSIHPPHPSILLTPRTVTRCQEMGRV